MLVYACLGHYNTSRRSALAQTSPGTQVDVGNERCMGKQPEGWWGWKLFVATAEGFSAGTDVFTQAKVDCGNVRGSFVRMTDKVGDEPCEKSWLPPDLDCHHNW